MRRKKKRKKYFTVILKCRSRPVNSKSFIKAGVIRRYTVVNGQALANKNREKITINVMNSVGLNVDVFILSIID